eukprot:511804-Hanusia_phi.AAC.3
MEYILGRISTVRVTGLRPGLRGTHASTTNKQSCAHAHHDLLHTESERNCMPIVYTAWAMNSGLTKLKFIRGPLESEGSCSEEKSLTCKFVDVCFKYR